VVTAPRRRSVDRFLVDPSEQVANWIMNHKGHKDHEEDR